MGTNTSSFSTREEMEDFWRRGLTETEFRYRETTAQYRKLLQEQPDGKPHDPNGALALARIAQSEALADYARVLRIFTDLTVHGKIPEGQLAQSSSSV